MKNTYQIPNTKYQILDTKSGFTLIEVMIAIGIVSILAAVVLVSMQSYGAKARASRAMAQVSSAVPAMISCWGNDGDTNSSGYICKIGGADAPGYGSWPTLPNNYAYNGNSITKAQSASPWFFSVTNTESAPTICCNSKMNSCGQPTVACSATATW